MSLSLNGAYNLTVYYPGWRPKNKKKGMLTLKCVEHANRRVTPNLISLVWAEHDPRWLHWPRQPSKNTAQRTSENRHCVGSKLDFTDPVSQKDTSENRHLRNRRCSCQIQYQTWSMLTKEFGQPITVAVCVMQCRRTPRPSCTSALHDTHWRSVHSVR